MNHSAVIAVLLLNNVQPAPTVLLIIPLIRLLSNFLSVSFQPESNSQNKDNMAQARSGRIQQELQKIMQKPPPSCTAGPVAGNINQWQATILGPPSSPYQGGLFKLTISFPPDYPNVPPKVKFLTKVYHMNINEEGYICLDILRESKWKSEITVGQILLSICNLLSHPNPDDPLDWEKQRVFKRDRIEYSKLCQAWTKQYAK